MKNFFRKIKTAIRNIKFWFKTIVNDQPWDSYYLYELEYQKLKQMRDYFQTSDIVVNSKRIVMEITLAMKLIDIILERDTEYLEYLDRNFGNLSFTDIKTKPLNDDTAYIPVYVNLKHAEKYIKWLTPDTVARLKKEKKVYHFIMDLRCRKAECLYYKLRQQFTGNWWD